MRLSQGVIIDVDGTLVDSMGARAQAWSEALHRYGHPSAYAEMLKMAGLAPNEILIRATGFGLDAPEGRAIYDQFVRVYRTRLVPRLLPFVGARQLVEQLLRTGLRLAVATTDPADVVEATLRAAKLEPLLHRTWTPPSGGAIGSNREMLKATLDRLGCSPPNVRMIADAPFDIEAGNQLNVPVIALRSSLLFSAAELKGAEAVYNDPGDLLRSLASSPIASLLLTAQSVPA